MVEDPLVMPLARELLECYQQELLKLDYPPENIQLRPGILVAAYVSQDRNECCEGLAWVRPGPFYPSSSTFPVQDTAPIKGGQRAWVVTLEMGAMRCAPTPEAEDIPSDEEWDQVTQAVMDDAAAMRRAICCFIDAKQGRSGRVLAGAWQPIEVEGGCVGGTLPITVQGPMCDCPDAGPTSS